MVAKLTVSISGIDGSGKTMLAKALKLYFSRQRKAVVVIWFRWRAFIQHILFMYSNLRGLKRFVRTVGGNLFKRHFFEEDRIATKLYPLLLLFDLTIFYLLYKLMFKLRHADVIIYDRQFIDVLIDVLTFLTKSGNSIHSPTLRYILRYLLILAMQADIKIVLDVPPQLALNRKKDIWESYEELYVKRNLYLVIAKHFNTCLINTTGNFRETLRKAIRCLEHKWK